MQYNVTRSDVVVIGGGQSGLGAGSYLRRAGRLGGTRGAGSLGR